MELANDTQDSLGGNSKTVMIGTVLGGFRNFYTFFIIYIWIIKFVLGMLQHVLVLLTPMLKRH